MEGERAGVLDVGDHQTARAVFTGNVHRDAEIDLGTDEAERLPVALRVSVIQCGDFGEGFDDRPSDDMRERDLAFAGDGAVLIDDAAVLFHHLDGDSALGGSERNKHAGAHILGNASGGPAQCLKLLAGGRLDGRGGGYGHGRGRGGWMSSVGAVAVRGFKYVLPAFVDGGAVVQILLIELVFEPAIDAQIGAGFGCHGGRERFLYYDSVRRVLEMKRPEDAVPCDPFHPVDA